VIGEAEDLTAKLRNLVDAVSKNAGLPRLKTKREQLKAISETIEQMGHKNVPVPDDLNEVKKSLTDEIEKGVRDQVVLYFLKEQLSQILATIENNDGSKYLKPGWGYFWSKRSRNSTLPTLPFSHH